MFKSESEFQNYIKTELSISLDIIKIETNKLYLLLPNKELFSNLDLPNLGKLSKIAIIDKQGMKIIISPFNSFLGLDKITSDIEKAFFTFNIKKYFSITKLEGNIVIEWFPIFSDKKQELIKDSKLIVVKLSEYLKQKRLQVKKIIDDNNDKDLKSRLLKLLDKIVVLIE